MVLVEVRGPKLDRRCRVTDYSKLPTTQLSCDVGTWSLTVPLGSEAAAALEVGGGIIISADNATRTTPALLSGRCTKLAQSEVADPDTGRSVTSSLVATGVTDEAVLASRLALPQDRSLAVADYWDETGPLETVMCDLVAYNAGALAGADRAWPELDVQASTGRGPSYRMRPDRYQNLLVALQDAVQETTYALTFRVVQVDDRLVFRVVQPRDLSRLVVLGFGRGNLAGYTLTQTDATATAAYAGGTGDLAARTIVTTDQTPDGDPRQRREVFLDQNNESDTSVLAAKNTQALAAGQAGSSVSMTPLDSPDATYLVDYDLDDRVSFLTSEGGVFTDRVAKVEAVMDTGTARWTPTVASDGASLSGVRLIDYVRGLARQLAGQRAGR